MVGNIPATGQPNLGACFISLIIGVAAGLISLDAAPGSKLQRIAENVEQVAMTRADKLCNCQF